MNVQCQLKPRYIEVLDFILRNNVQIAQKSRAYFWINADDFTNEIAEFILDKGRDYDPAKGTQEAFVFGNVEKKLRRATTEPLTQARSFDSDCEEGAQLRRAMESIHSSVAEPIYEGDKAREQSLSVSASATLKIANAVSGLDTHDIASRLGVGTRRVRQLINETLELCLSEQHEELLKNKLFTLV